MIQSPEIRTIAEKKLIGKHLPMTFAENRTHELWRSFMPRRNEIRNRVGTDLFSLQVYGSSFDFKKFDPHSSFEKWALAEVTDFSDVPAEMETFVLPAGTYAVFLHKGPASSGPATFGYIFGTWLPGSEYVLDDRPHFELLGAKYKNEDPESEEEIWIPVRKNH